MKSIFVAVLCVLCALTSGKASAEPMESQFQALQIQVQQLTGIVQDPKRTVDAQRVEIDILRSSREARIAEAVTPPASVSTGPRVLQGRWNPDIGVVADTVLALDTPKADEEGADRVSVRELELVFGSA